MKVVERECIQAHYGHSRESCPTLKIKGSHCEKDQGRQYNQRPKQELEKNKEMASPSLFYFILLYKVIFT